MSDTRDALRACEERFRNLIARNADAMVVVDGDGLVRFVNPAAERLFGRPADDLVGSAFGFPAVAGETSEVDVVGPRGATTAAEMRVVETEWEGHPAQLAVLRDCTERKQAETEREQLLREQVARAEVEQALRERDAFLAVASHELKTPLSNLSFEAQLLARRLDLGRAVEADQLRTVAGRIDEQTRRLARLVTRLVDVADIHAGRLALTRRRIDLARLVTEVVAERQALATVHTISLTPPVPPRLEATVDPARVAQLLTDLLDNAVEHSPEGGLIEVALRAGVRGREPGDGEGEGLTSSSQPLAPGSLELSVRDRGQGVPPEKRAWLFERFTRSRPDDYVSGLGLGLFISRHVAELHGGRLEAEFPADGGTRFVLTLPVEGSQA